MHDLELTLFVLLVAVALLASLAIALRLPYPILLVLGGLAIGFIPGVPSVELDPDLVLLIFLPPLLYGAAFFTSLRDLRANVRTIGLLAIGLVLLTMLGVAVVAHLVIGLSWPVSFVLGAIVSPTDAVAPTAVVRRFSVPRRIVYVLEGESLINDWTALVLYKFAVAAVVTGTFSLPEAALEFVLTGVGGVAIGLAVGFVVRELRRRIDDPPTEIAISLITGYAAYLPAEELGLSGVLAAVTVGIFMGWHAPELTTPVMRLQGIAFWEIVTFLLNVVLFMLIGLQLPTILDQLSGEPALTLAGWGAMVGALVIAIRAAWVFLFSHLPRLASGRLREGDPGAPWQQTAVIAWSGMRGAVSLAAALALPLSLDSGAPFPERELVIFLAFSVIIGTLVVQGLTLTPLIAALGLEDDGLDREEEIAARLRITDAALDHLDKLADEDWVYEDTVDRLRGQLGFRRRRFTAKAGGDGADPEIEDRSQAYQQLLRRVYERERGELLTLRNEGAISDEVRRRLERELDLEESRLES